MFCPQCGNAIEENARFCGKCGAPAPSPESAMESMTASAAPAASGSEEMAINPNARKIRIICIAVAAIVLIAAIVGVSLFAMNQKAHQTYPLRVNTLIAGSNVDETSGVPLRVQGTDFESNAVDERILVTTDDYTVDLMRGNYTLAVAGDPVGDSGALYSPSTPEATIDVTEDETKINGEPQAGEGEGAAAKEPELTMDFAVVPADKVTDELLQETREWMGEYGISQEETDKYITAATDHKQAELKRIAEERAEALRKAAFGSFPASFMFYSGAGGWSSHMEIKPDGSFEASWHDGDMGDNGPGYNSTMYRSEASGSFTVLEQVDSKTFKLQLNELKATHKAETYVDSSGLRTIWSADDLYGLGDVTSSPRQGYTLYLPGTSKSSLPEQCRGWLIDKPEILDCMVIVAPGLETWFSNN